MTFLERARESISTRRVSVFLKILSVLFLLGAASHLSSILGVGGTPWSSKPLLFRVADAVAFPLDVVVAVGLWRARIWAVITWLALIVFLQFVPMLLFTDRFAKGPTELRAIYGLLAAHALLVGIFLVLCWSVWPRQNAEAGR